MLMKLVNAWKTQPRGSSIERIVFGASGALFVLLFLLDFRFFTAANLLVTNATALFFGVAALLLTGFFPATGGTLLFVVILISGLFSAELSFLGLGIYLVAANWMYRGWYLPAVVGPLVVEGTNLGVTGNNGFIVAFILGMAIAAPAGLGVRWQSRRAELLEDQLRHVQEVAREEATDRLKSELHDTVARNLAQLILAAQKLPRGSEGTEESERIEALARNSLDAIRTLIKGQEAAPKSGSIEEAIASSKTMLREKKITLEVAGDESVCENSTHDQASIASLAIQEGALNILKYGRSHSTAELTFDMDDDSSLTMAFINVVGKAEEVVFLAGGFGLVNLTARAQSMGGDAYGWLDDDKWILTLTVPSVRTKDPIGELNVAQN